VAASAPRRAPRTPAGARRLTDDFRAFSLDSEVAAEFYDSAGRKVRSILRERPYFALGGAFLAGFLIGGGWRTRLGRLAVLATGRYVAMQVAERLLRT
jgi:hypothetical protein